MVGTGVRVEVWEGNGKSFKHRADFYLIGLTDGILSTAIASRLDGAHIVRLRVDILYVGKS